MMIASGEVNGVIIAHPDRRRWYWRAHGRARAAARRARRRGLRAGAGARRAWRGRADLGERVARAVRARTRRRDPPRVVRARWEGDPAVEQRRDLETVRSRR